LGGVESSTSASEHSPHILQDGAMAPKWLVPDSIQKFKFQIDTLPVDQQIVEARMFSVDVAKAGVEIAHFVIRQAVEDFSILAKGKIKPEGKGVTIIALPGFLSDDSVFYGMQAYLANRGHRVVILSPEGGRNVTPIVEQEEPLISKIAEIRTEIGEDGVLGVVGHSRGALLNMIMAIRNHEFHDANVDFSINLGGPVVDWVNSTLARSYVWWQQFLGGDDFQLSDLRNSVRELDKMNFTSIGNIHDLIVGGVYVGHFIPINGSHAAMPVNRLEVLPEVENILARQLTNAA